MSAWLDILKCISQLELAQLAGAGHRSVKDAASKSALTWAALAGTATVDTSHDPMSLNLNSLDRKTELYLSCLAICNVVSVISLTYMCYYFFTTHQQVSKNLLVKRALKVWWLQWTEYSLDLPDWMGMLSWTLSRPCVTYAHLYFVMFACSLST